MALPQGFPHLRASSSSFDGWADGLEEVTPAVIEEGVSHLGRRERKRLARAFATVVPEAEPVLPVLLAAAVVAGLAERERPDVRWLDLLDTRDPAETLAYVLEPGDVWSWLETGEAEAAVAAIDDDLDDEEYEARWNDVLAREATRLATREHHRRLARLVRRLSAFEPCECHPRAWEAIGAACVAFERDREVRDRLLVMLLTDSLGSIWQRQVPRAA